MFGHAEFGRDRIALFSGPHGLNDGVTFPIEEPACGHSGTGIVTVSWVTLVTLRAVGCWVSKAIPSI